MPRTVVDPEPALLEQAAERLEREEPCVGQVEDAAFAVVELADQQHQAVDEKPDVGGAHEQLGVRRKLQGGPKLLDERLRRRQVFDDVEQQDIVVVSAIEPGKPSLRSCSTNPSSSTPRTERKLVDAGDLGNCRGGAASPPT